MFKSEKAVIEQELKTSRDRLRQAERRLRESENAVRAYGREVDVWKGAIAKAEEILALEKAEAEEFQASVANWSNLAKTADIETIRTNVRWGTFGKSGKEPLKYVLLCNLSDDHIGAILATQAHIGREIARVFQRELEYRKGQRRDTL